MQKALCLIAAFGLLPQLMLAQGKSKEVEAQEYGHKMAVIAGDYANEERNGRLLKTILLNASNDCEVRPRDAANMMQKAWNLLKERGLDVDESYLQAITSMYKLAARANIKPNKKWDCGQMWAGYVLMREKGFSPEASVNGLVMAAKTGEGFTRIK